MVKAARTVSYLLYSDRVETVGTSNSTIMLETRTVTRISAHEMGQRQPRQRDLEKLNVGAFDASAALSHIRTTGKRRSVILFFVQNRQYNQLPLHSPECVRIPSCFQRQPVQPSVWVRRCNPVSGIGSRRVRVLRARAMLFDKDNYTGCQRTSSPKRRLQNKWHYRGE